MITFFCTKSQFIISLRFGIFGRKKIELNNLKERQSEEEVRVVLDYIKKKFVICEMKKALKPLLKQ